VDTFDLPAAPRPANVAIRDGGQAIEIAWAAGGHVSTFRAAFLRDIIQGESAHETRQLWTGAELEDDLPAVDYQAVMAGDDGLRAWLEAIARVGFCFVRGVPAEPEATRRLAERIGPPRSTIFGDLWDFTADLAHGDTAYTNLEVSLHTDGTYTLDPPGLQMFHCLHFDGSGAQSILADGFRVAAELKRDDPAAFEVLSHVRVPGQYIEKGVHLRARHPIIGLDEKGNPRRICFNNHDRAAFLPQGVEVGVFYDALRAFHRLLADRARHLRFTLKPTEVLLFDNWRVLHARTAYTGRRRLAGCYLNREDFESRLRVLRANEGTADKAACAH